MSVGLIIILAGYIICWQGYRMKRKVSGLGHVALVASLMGTLANSSLARLSEAHPHSVTVDQYVNLFEHIFVVISCAGLYVFRLSDAGHTIHSVRTWKAIGCAVAVSASFAALIAISLHYGVPIAVSVDSYRSVTGFLYNVIEGIYFGITMLLVALWMVRRTRRSDQTFKIGVRVAAAGVFAMSMLSLGRAVPVVLVFFGGPVMLAPPGLLGSVTALAFPLIFVGLSYPIAVSRCVAYRSWKQQEKVALRLANLWRICATAYPEIVLRPTSLSDRLRHRLWKPYRLKRQRTEIFDGLAKLLLANSPANVEGGEGEAESMLHVAVKRYDETHPRSVEETIISQAADDREGIPEPRKNDQTTQMLLTLAELLRNVSPHAHTSLD